MVWGLFKSKKLESYILLCHPEHMTSTPRWKWLLQLYPSSLSPRDKEARTRERTKGCLLAKWTLLNSFLKTLPSHFHWLPISHPPLQGRLGNVVLLASHIAAPNVGVRKVRIMAIRMKSSNSLPKGEWMKGRVLCFSPCSISTRNRRVWTREGCPSRAVSRPEERVF